MALTVAQRQAAYRKKKQDRCERLAAACRQALKVLSEALDEPYYRDNPKREKDVFDE